MNKLLKVSGFLFVLLLGLNFHVEKSVEISSSGNTEIINRVSMSSATARVLPQDKRMKIGACSCGNGRYAVGWSCMQPGNECFTSSGCFC